MPKVDIVNLIKVFAGKASDVETLDGVSARVAAERVRASCADQDESFEKWSAGIVAHCVIPPDHPFRALLLKRKVPTDAPLRTLGAIAYGTAKPWIVFRRISWEDGRNDFPEQMEKDWNAKQSLDL
ncbi:MAG: hypothetical protein PHF00_00230 [Elusimicrobia bacterium]|nr:hypothetical protein [Elusimicrobiota bacterium]